MPQTVVHTSQQLRAVLFSLATFTLWVFVDTGIKLMGEQALPPYEIIGCLDFCAVIFLLAMTLPRGKVRELWPRNPRPQIVRALLFVTNNLCVAFALHHLPLTIFYIVVFMSPIVIGILAAIFLREKMSGRQIAAILAGFAGVIWAIAPWTKSFGTPAAGGDWMGYAAAATAVLLYSAGTVWLRTLTQSETSSSLAFTTALVSAAFCGTLLLFHWVPVTILGCAILLCAALANLLANLSSYQALRYGTAATFSQFHYSQIMTGALIAYLIWHEVPSHNLLAGAALIIASGIYIANRIRAGKAA